MNRPLYYLACPIANPNPAVVEDRHRAASFALSEFMRKEWLVYSPLNHHFAVRDLLPHTWDFWEKPSLGMLDKCDMMLVLMLAGWRESIGVTHEIAHAKATGKTILCVPYPLQWTGGELHADSIDFNLPVNWAARRW